MFIQNLSPGTSMRLGLGAESLRQLRPQLIVCEITGYGDVGPLAEAKAYDLLVQAESGLLSVSGSAGPPGASASPWSTSEPDSMLLQRSSLPSTAGCARDWVRISVCRCSTASPSG